ncbi:hypothetical protein NFI96_002800 [Prochilodus magdalenae]|nr:hypothetical protein NFI96_002800 [Prochilodus magdalenae]
MIHHPHHTCSVVVLWGPLKNRVIQYTEKQMDYSLDLYTYRVSCMDSGADVMDSRPEFIQTRPGAMALLATPSLEAEQYKAREPSSLARYCCGLHTAAWGQLERYWSDCTVLSIKFGGGGLMVWGWGSGVGPRPLVPVRGTLNASADQETLDHSMLPTLWGQFGDGPFLFQHDRTPVHRASSIKTWRSESGVEELDWPAQSPDLHPIEQLWDELEWRQRARPSRPTSVSDLTDVLLEE